MLAAAAVFLAFAPTARATVVVNEQASAYDASATATAAARGPVSVRRVRSFFPTGNSYTANNRIFTRPVCSHDVAGFRLWWPESGATNLFADDDRDCSTLPAEVQVTADAAVGALKLARKMKLGAIPGDRRGRGRLARRGTTFTPQGPRSIRTPWPAGGSKAIDLLVNPTDSPDQESSGVDGVMFCNNYGQGYATVFGYVRIGTGADAASIRLVTAHEVFHAVQCIHRRMGLVYSITRGRTTHYPQPPAELVEGVASWFAWLAHPQPAVTQDPSGGSSVSTFNTGQQAAAACFGYDLRDGSSKSYDSAPFWLGALATRPAKRLFAVHRKTRPWIKAVADNRVFEKMIGRSDTQSSLRRLYQSVCRDRQLPGLGVAVVPEAFRGGNSNTLLPFGTGFPIGSTATAMVKPMSIQSVTAEGDSWAPGAWDDPALVYSSRLRATVTGKVSATVITARESVTVQPGQPVEVSIPPGGSVRILLLNDSRSAATTTVSTELVN